MARTFALLVALHVARVGCFSPPALIIPHSFHIKFIHSLHMAHSPKVRPGSLKLSAEQRVEMPRGKPTSGFMSVASDGMQRVVLMMTAVIRVLVVHCAFLLVSFFAVMPAMALAGGPKVELSLPLTRALSLSFFWLALHKTRAYLRTSVRTCVNAYMNAYSHTHLHRWVLRQQLLLPTRSNLAAKTK